jgi:hypothetical protein
MTTKTKIFVVLAILVGIFYSLEVVLTLRSQGFVGPVISKGAIATAAFGYAIFAIVKGRAPRSIGAKRSSDSP